MSESTTEGTTRDLRSYRHAVSDKVRDIGLGQVSSLLRGVQGLTQDQQVERFDKSLEVLNGVTGKVGAAITEAQEGRDYAAERDFEAHQAAKRERRGSMETDRPPPPYAEAFEESDEG